MAEEKAEEEIASRFPGEKIRSVCRAGMKPVPKPGVRAERGGAYRVALAIPGRLFITDQHLVFVAEKRNYELMMKGLAVLFALMGAFLVISNPTLGVLPFLLLSLVALAVGEAFLWNEMRRSSLFPFDRRSEKTKLRVDAEERSIAITSELEGFGWKAQERSYEISVPEGEKFPSFD